MLPTLIKKPFSDPAWLFETKWDGYRAIAFVSKGKYELISRNQLDMTANFPEIADIRSYINAEAAVIDGELVAIGRDGFPSFQLMQGRLGKSGKSNVGVRIIYYVFDLIHYNGYDLKNCELTARQELLQRIIRPADFLKYSDHVVGEGLVLFNAAVSAHFEGIIAKKLKSHYIEGRTTEWLKVKTAQTADVVVCGYTDPKNTRPFFGALVTGVYDGEELVYSGRVGGGFNDKKLREIFDMMQPLRANASPLATKIPVKEIHWLKPALVAEVRFSEWTRDHQMRHPVFMRLRADKKPRECAIEQF